MKYKGYTYTEDWDRDEDKSWYIHSITYNGRDSVVYVRVDYSQYCKMTEGAFKTLVDLDFPARARDIIPWTSESLERYKEELEYTKQYTIENDSLTEL